MCGVSRHTPEQTSTIEPRLLTKEDAANYLSISPRLLDDLVRRGDIRAVRLPGIRRIAFDTQELGAMVDRWKDRR